VRGGVEEGELVVGGIVREAGEEGGAGCDGAGVGGVVDFWILGRCLVWSLVVASQGWERCRWRKRIRWVEESLLWQVSVTFTCSRYLMVGRERFVPFLELLQRCAPWVRGV
jgi:hypothetical protein